MLDPGARGCGLLSPAVFNENGKGKGLLSMCIVCLTFLNWGADSNTGIQHCCVVLCCAVLGGGAAEDLGHPKDLEDVELEGTYGQTVWILLVSSGTSSK